MITRRQFLISSLGLGTALATTGLYARFIEPRWVEEVRLSLPIRHLPPELAGLTLVQLSDLHIGDRFDWGYLVAALQRVGASRPDFVVYTGDYVTYDRPEQLQQLAQVLEDAPLGRLGTAAILGNHDYGLDWRQTAVADRVASLLAERGMTVLRNQVATFAGLQIAGLDDYWSPNYKPGPALAALDPSQSALVLGHNPDLADEPIWSGYHGWLLAGHTHGGQVKPPFLPPPALPVQNKRYTAGRFDLPGDRSLYINRGLGCLWPVRFNARPEVTIFNLVAAGEPG